MYNKIKRGERMSDAIVITIIICLALIIFKLIDKWGE